MATIKQSFKDWSSFLETAENGKSIIAETSRHSRAHADERWTRTASFAASVKLGREGWPEGRKKIASLSSVLFNSISHKIVRTNPEYSITGHALEIGRYVAGRPDCWIDFSEQIAEGTGYHLVNLVMNCCVSGSVSTETIEKKGGAVCALVGLLELAGHRVRLEVVRSGCARSSRLITSVVIKEFDQGLNLDRTAFALAHPAMLRSLMFSVGETLSRKDLVLLGGETKGPALRPDETLPPEIEGDIIIGGSTIENEAWETDATAWVIGMLKKQGVSLK